ncbi:fructosamine kinase [Actinomadura craniellae]|uniref:Fructosamine kinase n=1 Tax=Actinomadura craniellae TaxID=2231787 RepID=A0A365H8I5_9ACTN|nr:fructosamine kinase family protein [Actinomadura craniellae]RAY15397.1 fructosamine kinase [Actinomadura craniellae]
MDDRARLADLVGARVRDWAGLGRRHAWRLYRAGLDDGREVFVKATAERSAVFAAEAAGLRWLAAPFPDGAPVAEVVAVDERMLVLPWLPPQRPDAAAAERFGRDLAVLHTAGAPGHGAPWPGFIAELPMDNTPGSREWPRWYAERRLAPYLERAAGVLGAAGVRLVERVIECVEDLAGPPEPPSRVHGDLWSGNVVWSGGRGVLVDPAAYGGHRETDLAMLELFGAPYLDRILAAYREVAPLSPGHRGRVPLYQLYPLLVHVVLFGGGYREDTVRAARAALAPQD